MLQHSAKQHCLLKITDYKLQFKTQNIVNLGMNTAIYSARKWFTLAILLLSMGLYVHVHAQVPDSMINLSLTDLMTLEVSIASKSKQEVNKAPGIITVITKKEIESYAAENLGQVLDKVVGAKFITTNVLTDNLVVFRGQSLTPYNNHVLILLNGRPVRDPITGGLNNTIFTGFPIHIIESIEIIRGPGSILYGSCAYSGVINILTQRSQNQNHVSAEFRSGSFGTFKQSYAVTATNEDLQIFATVQNSSKAGERFEFADGLAPTHDTAAAKFGNSSNAFITQINYKNLSYEGLYIDYRPYNLGGGDLNWVTNPSNVLDYYKYFGN